MTVPDPYNTGSLPMITPIIKTILVLIAFCVHYFRVHQILLFGVSLDGWAVPPECIVFCAIIGVLAIQQIGWETQLLKQAWNEK